ncbi:hypothetical protein WR25_23517 [Diploscapter pachys]|uniref:Serpin domain-containing protein n=1 Tax=Diploscapter pachys TaxID=2018661 RepID=A0A2A2KUX8_9BILA|nr:hypothetical protein WR25_23517 [Diploscapter pachys]
MFLEAETSFGVEILQQFPLNESFVFSPVSIALALSLVHVGAKGETKTQIANAICKGSNDDQLKQHYGFLSNSLMSAHENIEINLANKAFLNKKYPIKRSYLEAISKAYNASAQNLDFSQSAKSAGIMNDFVSENTQGRIQKLIDEREVSDAGAAFLINALYLNAPWENEFMRYMTYPDGVFDVRPGVTKKVIYIQNTEVNQDYVENDEVQVLSLSFKNQDYRFNIFLPKEKYGLEKFVKGLTGAKVQEMLGKMKSTLVNVRMPRMKVETTKRLNDLLKAVGIKKMFETDADLSELAEFPTYVSNVKHKATLELDESGVVASAATSVEMLAGAAPPDENAPKPIEFEADHPFLFALTFNNHLLFIGTFM